MKKGEGKARPGHGRRIRGREWKGAEGVFQGVFNSSSTSGPSFKVVDNN